MRLVILYGENKYLLLLFQLSKNDAALRVRREQELNDAAAAQDASFAAQLAELGEAFDNHGKALADLEVNFLKNNLYMAPLFIHLCNFRRLNNWPERSSSPQQLPHL
jgi:hypothetical protein